MSWRAAQHPTASQFPSASGKSLRQLAQLATSNAAAGSGERHVHAGHQPLRVRADQPSRAVHLRADRRVHRDQSFGARRGPVSGTDRPDGSRPAVPQPAELGPGRPTGDLLDPHPHPATAHVRRAVADEDPRGLVGATGEVAVAKSWPIPGVGQRPPAVATDTLATVHGNVSLLTTRAPPEQMHSVSFNQVLGKRPVLLSSRRPSSATRGSAARSRISPSSSSTSSATGSCSSTRRCT